MSVFRRVKNFFATPEPDDGWPVLETLYRELRLQGKQEDFNELFRELIGQVDAVEWIEHLRGINGLLAWQMFALCLLRWAEDSKREGFTPSVNSEKILNVLSKRFKHSEQRRFINGR